MELKKGEVLVLMANAKILSAVVGAFLEDKGICNKISDQNIQNTKMIMDNINTAVRSLEGKLLP